MPLPAVCAASTEPILVLAPMATLGHAALRSLIHEYGGCDLYFSEMISAEALIGGTPFESYYIETAPDPSRLVFQLLGKRPEAIVEAARRIGDVPCAGIDINFGCSAPHIRKAGGGIAWTQDADRAAALVSMLRKTVPAGKTVSVKLRLGEGEEPEETITLARRLVDAGVDFLSIHPRRMKEGYARPARWAMISRFVDQVAVPIIGNGDVRTEAEYRAAAKTGVAGVMIGRGAVARPWVFRELRSAPAGGTGEPIDLPAVADRFHELLVRWQPREFLHSRVRRFHAYFLATLPFGTRLAAQVQAQQGFDQIVTFVRAYFDLYPQFRYAIPAVKRSEGIRVDG